MSLVSILVPIYNVEKYLGKCLKSLEAQTYPDIEIIIINDGSKDQSRAIAQKYADKYQNISIYDYENSGISQTRNRALMHAHGDYVMFVDSDDFIESDMVSDMVKYMQRYDCDIVMSGYVIDFGWIRFYRRTVRKGIYTNIEALRSLANGTGVNNYPWAKLYKKQCFDNIEFPVETKRFEDAYTIFKTMIKANRIGSLPKRYYHYVHRKGSLTNRMNLETAYDMRKSVEYQDAYLKRYFPGEKFSFDIQYYNADMMILYVMIAHYDKTDHVTYQPADLDWKKIPPLLRCGYYIWKAIAQMKVGSFKSQPQGEWK